MGGGQLILVSMEVANDAKGRSIESRRGWVIYIQNVLCFETILTTTNISKILEFEINAKTTHC